MITRQRTSRQARRASILPVVPPLRSLTISRPPFVASSIAIPLTVACVLTAGVGLAGGCTPGIARPAPPPSPAESLLATAQLTGILRDHWTYVSQEFPVVGVWAGSRQTFLPDRTVDRWRAHAQFARAALRALGEVQVEALSPEEYVTWLALEWDMESLSRRPFFFDTDLTDLAPRRSPIAATVDLLAAQPFTGEHDTERYLLLLDEVAPMIDSVRAGLEARRQRGIVATRAVVPRAARFVRSFLRPPGVSPFRPDPARLVNVDSTLASHLLATADTTIGKRINPALERLAQYLEGDYARAAPDRIGLGQYPGGVEHYRMLVRHYGTIAVTPEEAHAIGLGEVERLAELAQAALRAAGVRPTRDSLRDWLARAPEFGTTGADGFLERLRTTFDSASKRPPLPLEALPTTLLEIDTMAASEAEFAPLARYVPPSIPDPVARYHVAFERLRGGSGAGATGLVYRDLLPGRHALASWQRVNDTLPAFRRAGDYAAFSDGWGLYVLELADSLVSDLPVAARLGIRLQLVRAACGLVVDTGINYFGWTREQALEFLRQYLPDDDEALEREFLVPAIEDPASLVAGTLGAREFRGFRRWAQEELDEHFDPAEFHTSVLRGGALPLPVVGARLEWWLWEQTAGRDPAPGP